MSSHRSGRNRSTGNGSSSGVQRSYASQFKEYEPLFQTYEHLSGLPRADSALKMLRQVASLVKPIMRKRGWKVQILAEFLPAEHNLLGLNINKGYKICIRLRYHNNPDLFLPIEQVVDTMLHELSHNVWGEHDSKFHKLWDELRDEHEVLVRKGYTGEGFLGEGRRLGHNSNRPLVNTRDTTELRRRARESAEKRKQNGMLSAGSGRRLGGTPIHLLGNDTRQVIADQVERRNTINRGCGSGRPDAVKLSQQPDNQVFKTQAEEDEANERAITQAIFELMEEEEQAKLQGAFNDDSVEAGLAWSKDRGLYDLNSQVPLKTGLMNDMHMSEEEQMKWAIEQSIGPAASPSTPALPMPPVTLRSKPKSSVGNAISFPQKVPDPEVFAQPAKSPRSHSDLSHASSSPVPIETEAPDDDQWTCAVCTLANPGQFLACDACGEQRPQRTTNRAPKSGERSAIRNDFSTTHGQRPRSVASSLSALQQSTTRPGLGWNCRECGAFMEHQWWTCSACGSMKASS